jgi:hypothetical protein
MEAFHRDVQKRAQRYAEAHEEILREKLVDAAARGLQCVDWPEPASWTVTCLQAKGLEIVAGPREPEWTGTFQVCLKK